MGMEKAIETHEKLRSQAIKFLEVIEAEANKIDPDMVARIQNLPIEIRLRILLFSTSEMLDQNQTHWRA
jgi:hypothetical protein